MSKIKIVEREDYRGVSFLCPGCGDRHSLRTDGLKEPSWTWNGSVDSPTITPSIKSTSGHYMPGFNSSKCWCTFNAAHPDQEVTFTCGLCHSFVANGKIQFLGDCTHALAGQTVDLPPISDHEAAR